MKKEVLKMGPTLYEEGLLVGIKIGLKNARDKEKEDMKIIAQRMLKNGISIEEIHTYTEIPKNDILKLTKHL
ncbi:MAG: hypothetical protein HUK28_06510 [Methanobrevibacter sp.]|nr:hypothetical protein [Methanobrevibacter sp.]